MPYQVLSLLDGTGVLASSRYSYFVIPSDLAFSGQIRENLTGKKGRK